jgi:tetratricopeptide (TPR) repeat protein
MVYLNNIGGAKIGLGQFEEAEMDLQDVIFLAGDHGFGQLSETYRFLAESYLGQSKLLMAERTANKALILGRGIESLEYQAAAWRLLGQVAARLGEAVRVEDEPDAAESRTCSARDCFTESNRLTVESGMKGEQAQTLRAWAKYEIEQGDRERGRALLKDANALFVDLGVAVEQDARARL